jgi:O-methyltransferase involved in polyketide biosynthesis
MLHRNIKQAARLPAGVRPMAAFNAALIEPSLTGVPETMLWALHNRASEASRRDGVLIDPDSVRIRQSINYNFNRRFGPPAGSLAARAAAIDKILERWITSHPNGTVVSLGEGLETQSRRVDNGRIRWLSVDLPDAIRLRERFLPTTERFRHIAISALDPAWMDAVDPSCGVFIVAQGLLMYLQPDRVQNLLAGIANRFPAAEMVFDVVPRWFSALTRIGLHQTPHYRLPSMPWGINRDEIKPTLRRWLPHLASVNFLAYHLPRTLPHLISNMPFLRHEGPSLVHLVPKTETLASNIIPFRTKQMASLNTVLNAATRNASSSNDLARAAGQIIAKRVALGVAAALDPTQADHAEFGRMMPEKLEAFSAAGIIMLQQSNEAGWEITRLASDEVMTTARATLSMASWANPVAMAQAQGQFALSWFNRATTNFFAMSMMAFGAHEAAMAPIRQTIAANTQRLAR